VSLIWCFDVNKKLSVKLKDEEPKRVALRLCKIKKKIEDESLLAARTQAYQEQKDNNKGFETTETTISGIVNGCSSCKREVSTRVCTGCRKPTYECCSKCFAIASGSSCACGNRF